MWRSLGGGRLEFFERGFVDVGFTAGGFKCKPFFILKLLEAITGGLFRLDQVFLQ